jgi:radical SAM protein with 4Fe4S-binding SPASM domain
MCTYCPQDKLAQAYQDPIRVMTKEVFARALEQIPKNTAITFAGFNEPWTNRDCNKFVELALLQGRKVAIFTTLYSITVDECKELIKLVLDHPTQVTKFCIHLPDAHGNMRGWRPSKEYNTVLTMINSSIPGVQIMTMSDGEKIYPTLPKNIVSQSWPMYTRANNLDTSVLKGQPFVESPMHEFLTRCSRDSKLTQNVLLPNGDLALCCMDYGLKHIIGNILTHTYEEIQQGPAMTKIREMSNELGYNKKLLCKSCDSAYCRTPWNDQEVYEMVKLVDPDSLGDYHGPENKDKSFLL